jgi:P4 family phage/plasmid primase-like protien
MQSASRTLYQAEDLWYHIYGDERGILALGYAEPAADAAFHHQYFDYPEQTAQAAERARELSEGGFNVWHCAHLLTAKRRVKENAAVITALYVDGDGAEVPPNLPQPTAIVKSSPGREQFYWRLSMPIPPEIGEGLNRRLAYALGADKSGWDLTQLLRPPGTKNRKYPDAPAVEVEELEKIAHDAGDLDRFLPQLPKVSRNGHTQDDFLAMPPVDLGPEALKVWRGEKPKAKDTGEVDRSASLMKIGRVLYDAGGERPLIVRALRERDETLGWSKYAGRHDAAQRYHEIVDELESNGRNGYLHRRTTGEKKASTGFNLTDLGNAERFIAQHGANVRYCYAWSRWLAWSGLRWERDESGRIHRLAKETVRGIYQEAAAAPAEDRRKDLAKHAARSEAEAKIRAMLELAKSEVPISPDELDADPWLLNVPNGTLDLRTGELREHRREDLLTKMAGAGYHPGAEAPLWTATLERVLPSPALRTFFKKLCGYAITGDVSEHILAVLYGTGANGKSTSLNALLEAAGDYGMQSAPDLLVAKKGAHPTEVADLFGKRLVASIEVEDGRRLAESLVKQLTGGDKVRARRMRQDFWQFDPTHKVFMAVNHKPEVRGTDTAIWRRIRLIPFTETIPPGEQDKHLPEKLRGELSGILAWAVEGCLEWQREGLQAPEEVRKATGQYRSEMDVIGAFLQDECEIGPNYREPFTTVYKRYEEWCEEGGERAETRRKFNARLKERGSFETRRSGPGGANEWHGLRLLKKQSGPFAGKLKQRTEKDYKRSENTPSRENGESNFSSSVTSVDDLSEEQERKIRKRVQEGMSEKFAREAVLGKGWVEP